MNGTDDPPPPPPAGADQAPVPSRNLVTSLGALGARPWRAVERLAVATSVRFRSASTTWPQEGSVPSLRSSRFAAPIGRRPSALAPRTIRSPRVVVTVAAPAVAYVSQDAP